MALWGGSALGAPVADMWKYINATENTNAQLAQAQQAQQVLTMQEIQAMMNHNHLSQQPEPTPINVHHRAKELFVYRMGGVRNDFALKLGDFIQTHVHADQVHLFYCFGGRPGVATEQVDIFPSDQLIAQFRMILA